MQEFAAEASTFLWSASIYRPCFSLSICQNMLLLREPPFWTLQPGPLVTRPFLAGTWQRGQVTIDGRRKFVVEDRVSWCLFINCPTIMLWQRANSQDFNSSCIGASVEIMNARFDEEPKRKRLKQSSIEESFKRHRSSLKSKVSLHLPGRSWSLVSRFYFKSQNARICCYRWELLYFSR